jgi:outer membrane protein assembly factor BamD
MKKTRQIELNLLILLILCLFLGNVFASENDISCQKINHNTGEICSALTANTSPIDIKSKKKKTKKSKISKGKVNFETFRQSFTKAMSYYDKKAYLSAARIFEELYPLAIGTSIGDTILFYFADSYFQNNDYQMAAFHFKDYIRRYPGTERTELAALNAVKALYYSSPEYQLDQYTTHYAIDEVKLFIQQYPYSKHIEECNEILDNLHNKLAKKEMEMIKMYYDTENYEATQIMVRNFLKSYSYSKYAPEVLSILVRNNYDFARKSVEHKKYYRYKECVEAFEKLQMLFPESSYLEESKKISADAEIQIKKLEELKK